MNILNYISGIYSKINDVNPPSEPFVEQEQGTADSSSGGQSLEVPKIPNELKPFYPPQQELSKQQDDQLAYATFCKESAESLAKGLSLLELTNPHLVKTAYAAAAGERREIAQKQGRTKIGFKIFYGHESYFGQYRDSKKSISCDIVPPICPEEELSFVSGDERSQIIGAAKRFPQKVYDALLSEVKALTDEEVNNDLLPGGAEELHFERCQYRCLGRYEQELPYPRRPYRWRFEKCFVIYHPRSEYFDRFFALLNPIFMRLLNTKQEPKEIFFQDLGLLAWALARLSPLEAGSAGTTELLIKSILIFRGFQLPPLKDAVPTWDLLAMVIPAEKFAQRFITHMFVEKPVQT